MVIQPGKGTVGPAQKVFLQANQRGGISAGGIGCVCVLCIWKGEGGKETALGNKEGYAFKIYFKSRLNFITSFPEWKNVGKRNKNLKEILTPEKKKKC